MQYVSIVVCFGPVNSTKTWPDGSRSPFRDLVALSERNKGVDRRLLLRLTADHTWHTSKGAAVQVAKSAAVPTSIVNSALSRGFSCPSAQYSAAWGDALYSFAFGGT